MDWRNFTESFLRWIHILAAVIWVGHLYFFNFVNANFAPTMDAETKKKVVPELMPRALFWFRWGALFTWATGLLLLGLVYYMGKQTLDPHEMTIAQADGTSTTVGPATWGAFQLAMLVFTFLAPFLYEVLVKSVLKTNVALFWGGFALVCVVLLGYHEARFTPRGWMIHLGAMFGTIMAFNVWFRIWPWQKQIITAIKNGQAPDAAMVAQAGARSRHNTFLSVPLIFLMVGQHSTWAFSFSDTFPILTAAMVLFAWGLTQHLLSISKKIKGF